MGKATNWILSNFRFAAEPQLEQEYDIRVADEAGKLLREHGREVALMLAEREQREAKSAFDRAFWQNVKRDIENEQDADQQSHTRHLQLS